VSPVEYAGSKRSLRAYIAVWLQIHCNLSSLHARTCCSPVTTLCRFQCGVAEVCTLRVPS